MRSFLLIAVLVLCIGAAAAVMAEGSPAPEQPKPVPRARWSEDWSLVRDLTPLRDTPPPAGYGFLRPIKYIPLNESGDAYLSLGGGYRLAYELYDQVDSGISNIRTQDALQHRVAVHADLHLNPHWRVFTQLGYASVHDRDGGVVCQNSADENPKEIRRLASPPEPPRSAKLSSLYGQLWRFG